MDLDQQVEANCMTQRLKQLQSTVEHECSRQSLYRGEHTSIFDILCTEGSIRLQRLHSLKSGEL